MAGVEGKAEQQLDEITECPICRSLFTDPRILSCIHTFCFECLQRTVEIEEKKPGDKMPCPLCRKEFLIPADGVNGLQKNFFMVNLLEFKTTLKLRSAAITCDNVTCSVKNEHKTGQKPTATKRCLDCATLNQLQKVSKDHQATNIGGDIKSERRRFVSMKLCTAHKQKPLDYYCTDCKKTVCVSCFIESHKSHNCKDVTTVDEEFRKIIQKKAWKTSNYAYDMLLVRTARKKRQSDFLNNVDETEKAIQRRNQELKDMIDRHTQLLFDDLSRIKSKHLKEMENEIEEIDRRCMLWRNFKTYCVELAVKGSASDICSSADQLIARADELDGECEEFIGSPHKSIEVCFRATDLGNAIQNINNNLVGNVEETITQIENFAVIVGLTKDVVKINLHRPNEISVQAEIPTIIPSIIVAAFFCNTMYFIGIGDTFSEIWKYNQASGWMKCASLVQGRSGHSAAFIDEVLYICGGHVDSFGRDLNANRRNLNSVESYSAVKAKCKIIGKLVHFVHTSGDCVPFNKTLYIFGGADKDNTAFNCVQVYNTTENKCSVLSKPMPKRCGLMRAVLWDASVILLGRDTCFTYNVETDTWQERRRFKTDVLHFGLVLANARIFVIGGGKYVRHVPLRNILDDEPIEWKIHATFPRRTNVHACVRMRFLV